jgi:hypothetical protein
VTRGQLEALGVVATQEKAEPAAIGPSHRPDARAWPSYQRCLEHPKAQKDGRPDRSLADFTWCMIAMDWGWSIEETAAQLMRVSAKAGENGEAYAHRTAQAAAQAERRGGCRR